MPSPNNPDLVVPDATIEINPIDTTATPALPRVHDGDLIKLVPHENSLLIEYVNTKGRRPAWRVYDKYGKGLLFTYDQMVEFHKYLTETLDPSYLEEGDV